MVLEGVGELEVAGTGGGGGFLGLDDDGSVETAPGLGIVVCVPKMVNVRR